MARLKTRDIRDMKDEEKRTKLKELKLELAKSKSKSTQGGSLKIREIKKTIARLLTIN